MKAFQDLCFDLLNRVLLWATRTGERQSRTVLFSPLMCRVTTSSLYLIYFCLFWILFHIFFFSQEKKSCSYSAKACAALQNQAVDFGSVWLYCVK